MIALIGTTIDRNTMVSSRNDMPSTNANTMGRYRSARSKKSLLNAVWPPTSTCLAVLGGNASGTYRSRTLPIDATAALLNYVRRIGDGPAETVVVEVGGTVVVVVGGTVVVVVGGTVVVVVGVVVVVVATIGGEIVRG